MATELVLVVDRSGSMEGLKCMAVDAINSLVSSQAKIGGDCNLSIVMFDNKPKVMVDSKPISRKSGVAVENHPFTVEKLFCESGGTALLDAVGYTIDHIEKSKKRLDKVIVAVLTDGEENESKKVTREELTKEIMRKEVDSWEFIYMIACDYAMTRSSAMSWASELGFAMILGVNASEYAESVAQIDKHITDLRKNDTVTNYAAPLAKTGYSREMKIGNFSARLMRAPRLKNEKSSSLPPGAPIPVFPVDALPGCPKDWIGGEGSYVCPVDEGWGLWFDFTNNDALNTAVMASVKGMNPITGQKLEGLGLERYEEMCPVHKEKFKTGHLCEKCGYKWPVQNYITYPNSMWWDGFRQADGTVRQFFFSADEARDVASAVIGKENTVPAFGFAFFEPIKARGEMENRTSPAYIKNFLRGATVSGTRGGGSTGLRGPCGSSGVSGVTGHTGPTRGFSGTKRFRSSGGISGQSVNSAYYSNSRGGGGGVFSCNSMASNAVPDMASNVPDTDALIGSNTADLSMTEDDSNLKSLVAAVSVGAGAEISQELQQDSLAVSEWKPKASVIRLYFVFKEQFKKIIKEGGVKDLTGRKEGYLKGVPVG